MLQLSFFGCKGPEELTLAFWVMMPCILAHVNRYDVIGFFLNRLTPNDSYMCRTALLTSKRCVLYIYSTDISTEYFKHALYSPFFSLQNAVCFIMLTCLVPVLFTFYIQSVIKLK